MHFANFSHGYGTIAFVDFIIIRDKLAHHLGKAQVPFGLIGSRAGDDERGAGFIDEDVIHFVDDGVIMAAL